MLSAPHEVVTIGNGGNDQLCLESGSKLYCIKRSVLDHFRFDLESRKVSAKHRNILKSQFELRPIEGLGYGEYGIYLSLYDYEYE